MRRPRGHRTSKSSPTRVSHFRILALSSRAFGGTQLHLGGIPRCPRIAQFPSRLSYPSIGQFQLLWLHPFICYTYQQWRPPPSHLREWLSSLFPTFPFLHSPPYFPYFILGSSRYLRLIPTHVACAPPYGIISPSRSNRLS